ncbi:adenosylcobinamide-phosphate synthase [Halorubrum ezzemoulense]|uniref:Probable cobalamin biosynthesis protein CobD n=1 Tax=Halorubrum ezzemoulense TaxID=337243 RepID=A0A238VA38_HALEZ|nr:MULTISPECIES: CobD/CbiB family cobalamin biosynthesis protein [Halorubrum]TKX40183.1 cobalamin biosynthesis protein [Halorubrum sp. CGM4_25_10-8A]SNR31270.1 adenosylcobinamide-phosphate synthase [Halorubrum ezzemoulense]
MTGAAAPVGATEPAVAAQVAEPAAALIAPAATLLAPVALALALDLAAAEPPHRAHPVALFGTLVGRFDREWGRPRLVGVAVAAGLPLAAAALCGGVVWLAAAHGPRPGGVPVAAVAAAAGVCFSVASLRMLLDVTGEVVAETETDPDAARESVRALVGRDPADLSPAALRSAAVESAAENLADGFVAPLVWFAAGATGAVAVAAVGGSPGAGTTGVTATVAGSAATVESALAAGVAAAAWVKAVNTLDSMLGYRSKPVGWASARLDDAAMFLPARVAACCLAVAARSPGSLRRARSLAREPASPNSGWPMATAAAALGVRLEKPGAYVLDGGPEAPSPAAARDAVRLVGVAGGVTVAAAAAWVLALAGVVAWS